MVSELLLVMTEVAFCIGAIH